jgi:peptide/nickel transport system substrate-binding protein
MRLKMSAFLLILLLFASCFPADQTVDDKKVFRYNEHANITSLDPAFAKDQRNIWPCHQIYNTLVKLDDQLNVEPDLARDWNISEDGLTYTFLLKDDILFHPHDCFQDRKSRQVDAQDVVFSLERLRSKALASPGAWVLNNVDVISAKNVSTVEIKLKKRFPAFLGLLSMKFCSVIPDEVKKCNIDLRDDPIGTGAFYLKRWEENEKMVLRHYKDYHEKDAIGRKLPYLEAVSITFLTEKKSEFMQFIQGNLDFMSGLAPSYKDEMLTGNGELNPKYEERIQLEKAPYLNTEYLGIFVDDTTSILQHKKLRQALNHGFDRQKMIRFMRNGIGFPANQGFISKGLPGFGTSGYSYQPEKAAQLIRSLKDEKGLENIELEISTNPSYLDLMEFIQKEYERLGLQVSLNVMPASTIRQKRSRGDLSIFRASWIADYPDAQNYLSLFYSANFAPNGPNYTHFKNAKFDSLYNTSLKMNTAEKRIPLYRKMDSLVMEKAPVIPLYYDEVVRFSQKNVSGLGINPINLLDLKTVKKQE